MADLWAVVGSVATAVAAGAAAISCYYAYYQVGDARKAAEVQAIASLSSQGADLYTEFRRDGIDDVPRLTSHLYLLWIYKNRGIINNEYYSLQTRTWRNLTCPASDKLKIYWQDDKNFRTAYEGSSDFLNLLDTLDGVSSITTKECK